MADMISADDAKKLLGCDTATLNEYINSGQLRASSEGGQSVVSREDVEALMLADSDDGTIILSGDSEDLNIDLGEVVDETAATMMSNDPDESGSITFTEDAELEVVSFDDADSADLTLDDHTTNPTESLSFTEENTAVMTSVDDTIVDQTASDLQTIDYEEEEAANTRTRSARRSVRSTAASAPIDSVTSVEKPIHPIFAGFAIVTTLVLLFFLVPFFIIGLQPVQDETFHTGERKTGVEDGGWGKIAGQIAGYSVIPDQKQHERLYQNNNPWVSNPDGDAKWRYESYIGSDEADDKAISRKVDSLVIDQVDNDQAVSLDENGAPIKTYSIQKDENGIITEVR